MKKLILIFLLGLIAFAGKSQTNYGYTYIGQRYEWLAGLFKALGFPVGDSARFQTGQHQRQGQVYLDTVNTPASPNGFYIYEDPTGGNSPYWNLQTRGVNFCFNHLITPWNVSWQGSGFNFTVHGGQPTGQGQYQIGCSIYSEDSTTVTLNPSDPVLERIDVIYLDATGIHVREGDYATVGTAQKPSITLDEIELTFITVSPGTTEPTLTQLIVWNENTESIVTNIGTTTDPNNLTNVFIGLKSVNISNWNHNDLIRFDKVSGSWNVLGYDGLSLAFKLKAPLTANVQNWVAVALYVGTTIIGSEVIVPLVKTELNYQQATVPMSAFNIGAIANTNITRVQVRYLNPGAPSAVHPGAYLDYIYFVDGLNPPQQPGTAQFTLNMPVGFTVTPGNTAQSGGGWTITTQTALAGQYYTKEGWVTLPTITNKIGTLDGQAKSVNGASVFGDSIFMQKADTTYYGLMSPEHFRKLNRNDSVTNGTPGDTLLVKINDSLLLIKSLIAGANITFDVGADSIVINSIAGGGGGPGEGMTESGDSIHLGGLVGTPGIFFNDRFINTNRKSMLWTNGKPLTIGGPEWIAGQPNWAPYQFVSEDTLTANIVDPATQAMPLAGVYGDRTLYYADGILKTQKFFGHIFTSRINFKDTMTFVNQGGDYNAGFKAEREITGRGTGIQRIGVHGTGSQSFAYFSTPTFIANTRLVNNGNGIHVWGHLVGISSYLVMGSFDTLENYIFNQSNAFITSNGYVKNSYQYDMQMYTSGSRAQNSYGIRDQWGYGHWLRGNLYLGGGASAMLTSTDKLHVTGNTNITDSLVLGKASNINDTTGIDLVTRKRSDGSIFAIRADQLSAFLGAGGCSCTLAQTLLNDNVSGNQNIFMEGAASQLVFDYQNSAGYTHGITFRSGTSIGAATEVYLSQSTAQDSSIRMQPNAGSLIAVDLNLGKLTTERNIYFPDASGTIALTSDIPAPGGGENLDQTLAIGSTLTTDRTITAGANRLTITGTDAGLSTTDGVLIVNNTTSPGSNNAIVATSAGTNGRGFSGYATDGVGVYGEGANGVFGLGLSTGVGVYGQSTDGPGGLFTSTSSVGGTFFTNPTSTNNSAPIITLTRSTSGAGAANGLAGRIDFNLENDAGTALNANRLVARYTDVTAGSEDTEFDVYGLVNGVNTLFGTFNSTGFVGSAGLTQEQVEDIVGALFGTDNGDIDFTYNDGTPDVAAQIKAGAIVNADVNASAAIDPSKIASPLTKGFMYDVMTMGGVSTRIPRMNWFENFMGGVSSAAGNVFVGELVTGSGANASTYTANSSITGATGYGYGIMESGTTSTGRAAFSGIPLVNANSIGKVDNDYYYRIEFENVVFNDLSDGTDTYTATFGFKVDNAVTNGIYFTYTNGTNSGKWVTNTYNNATPETQNYSGTAVAADTEYDLAIEFYNQTVKFYLDGTLIATHTTQVPAAASAMQGVYSSILKSAGSNNRQIFIDNIRMRITHENDL